MRKVEIMEISNKKYSEVEFSTSVENLIKEAKKEVEKSGSRRTENLFCAHVIIWMKYKDENQNDYPIWENVYLVKAESEDEAWEKAERRGKEECENDDGLEVDGRPARWIYGGVRKLISVIEASFLECNIHENCEDIIELTWNEFTVPDKESLDKLISGDSVNVNYDE
jgi:Domain of unknown function (DUF4288)